MLQFSVIGNLGADAELHVENGNEFLTFKVAHTDRFKQDGRDVETTTWVSCVMNGRGDKLRQYLTKGQKVYVCGDGSVRTFHSAKMRQLMAGCNLFVRQIELVGARTDDVPAQLFDSDGVQHDVSKWYYCETAINRPLFGRSGRSYFCNALGWVVPVGATDIDEATKEAINAAPRAGSAAAITSETNAAIKDDPNGDSAAANNSSRGETSKKNKAADNAAPF